MTAKRSWTPAEHEAGLALFVHPHYRGRFRAQLAEGSIPDTVEGHFSSRLDPRYAYRLAHDARQAETSERLLRILRGRGAPSICYLLPDIEVDPATGRYDFPRRVRRSPVGKMMPLRDALECVVDEKLFIGVLISCIPGRLGFYRDHEWANERYVLERPK